MAPRLDDRRIARVSRRAAQASGPRARPARTGDHQGTLPRRAERRRRESGGVPDERGGRDSGAHDAAPEGVVDVLRNERALQPKMYKLPDEPVAGKVLIPGFRAATRVRGAFGWFTAGWIGRLAPGLAVYLNRNGTEPIDFTVAPALFPDERAAVERGIRMTPAGSSRAGRRRVRPGAHADAPALARHALDCLAWMIATGTLRLRDCGPNPGVELPSEDLALRRWRESSARPRIGQRDRPGRGRWGRAPRRRRVVGPREPSQGDQRHRHARRLVARQEPRDRGGRRATRQPWRGTSSGQHPQQPPQPHDYDMAAYGDGTLHEPTGTYAVRRRRTPVAHPRPAWSGRQGPMLIRARP